MADKRIQQIFSTISKKEHNDDLVDRLNYATTTKFLGFFAALILAKQVIGEALQCFIPAEYPVSLRKFKKIQEKMEKKESREKVEKKRISGKKRKSQKKWAKKTSPLKKMNQI